MNNYLIKHDKINKFITKILTIFNIPKRDRELLCKSLIGSSLRGVDSHGIRLFPLYVKHLEFGSIKKKTKYDFYQKNVSSGLIKC